MSESEIPPSPATAAFMPDEDQDQDQQQRINKIEKIDPKLIKLDPDNPNKMTDAEIEGLEYSMNKWGNDVRHIVIDQNNVVADGEHRLQIYLKQNLPEITVIRKYFKDDKQRRLFRQTMNKLHGTHDKQMDIHEYYNIIVDNDENISELARLTGMQDENEIFDYIKESYPDYVSLFTTDKVEEDSKNYTDESIQQQVEDIKEPITQLGDIWQLGNHRIICGDSTKEETINKLLIDQDQQNVSLVFADPPYNIGFRYNEYNDKQNKEEYFSFIQEWFNLCSKYSDNLIITPGPRNIHYYNNIREPTDIGIWYKSNSRSGASFFYFRRCEPILFYSKESPKTKRTDDYFDYNRESNTQIKEIENDVGVTNFAPFKPVKLLMDLLENYSLDKNKIVIDPFLGSGTTLIACEQTNRICYGIEQDPRYVDVIIQRWETYTGNQAQKVS